MQYAGLSKVAGHRRQKFAYFPPNLKKNVFSFFIYLDVLFVEVECLAILGLIETWRFLHFIEGYDQYTISVLSTRQQKPLFRGEHNGPGHFISSWQKAECFSAAAIDKAVAALLLLIT
jgi:hypothetical protein